MCGLVGMGECGICDSVCMCWHHFMTENNTNIYDDTCYMYNYVHVGIRWLHVALHVYQNYTCTNCLTQAYSSDMVYKIEAAI